MLIANQEIQSLDAVPLLKIEPVLQVLEKMAIWEARNQLAIVRHLESAQRALLVHQTGTLASEAMQSQLEFSRKLMESVSPLHAAIKAMPIVSRAERLQNANLVIDQNSFSRLSAGLPPIIPFREHQSSNRQVGATVLSGKHQRMNVVQSPQRGARSPEPESLIERLHVQILEPKLEDVLQIVAASNLDTVATPTLASCVIRLLEIRDPIDIRDPDFGLINSVTRPLRDWWSNLTTEQKDRRFAAFLVAVSIVGNVPANIASNLASEYAKRIVFGPS